MKESPLIGIDLGTTNSLVAVFDKGKPRLIPNAQGQLLTPSVVGSTESGAVLVGSAAKKLALSQPGRTAACFKRWMGEEREYRLGGQSYQPAELSSMVLRALAADAAADLGVDVERVVITVPAYFNQNQREATRLAGELAGLKVERIVNEPTAAALIYGFHKREADLKLLVLDLGGGTFDVTVMEIFEGTLEILSTAGESHLGGEDFTNALVSRALRELGKNLEVAELQDPLLVARLTEEAESAKRAIGATETGSIRLPNDDGTLTDKSAQLSIGAAEFEELVSPLMERLRAPTLRALRDANLTPNKVDEVLLIGGATRMPLVRRLAHEIFAKPPLNDVHPDQAVALGAAVQAALVADDQAVDDLVMTDVCPHTLGVAITKEFGNRLVEGYFMPVIHRNTTIPVSCEEIVATLYDGQQQLTLNIYQGEGRRVEENLLLGNLEVTGIPAGKKGQAVCVRFTYDLNGLLEVEAYIPATGRKQQVAIRHGDKKMSRRDVKSALKRMQNLKFYPREDLGNQHLIAFGAACLKEIDPYRRQQLEQALDLFEAALHGNDRQQFQASKDALLTTLSALGLPYSGEIESEDGA